MVGHAEDMLAPDGQLAEARDRRETALLQRPDRRQTGRSTATSSELRGLSEEEIAIVEKAAG
jgi:hypothetical protein